MNLEKDEFVTKYQNGYRLKESALVTALTYGVLDIGKWFITNRRLIYEGPKKGKKDLAATAFGGLLGKMLAREMESVAIRYDQITDLIIRPYGKIDKVLEIKYRDNGDVKSEYMGLPLIDRSKLETIKEDLERAPNIRSFCSDCGAPMARDETFCGQCGAKKV